MIGRGIGYVTGLVFRPFTIGVVCGSALVAWGFEHPASVPAWVKHMPASVSAVSVPAWVKNAPATVSSFVGDFLPERLLPAPRMVIAADRYHQCYIDGVANGFKYQFLADTGASSSLAFGSQHLKRLGIDPATVQYTRRIATANGYGRAADIRIRELRIGDSFVLRDVPASVDENLVGEPLIGAPLLRQWGFEMGDQGCALSLPATS